MSKPYQRGNFRAITRKRHNHNSNHYQIQVYIQKGNTWLDFGTPFDYLCNARLRVRNLDIGNCAMHQLLHLPLAI